MGRELRTELTERGIAPDCVDTILVVRDLLARVGDRWTMLVVTTLQDGPMRFTALHDNVPGISQRMLGHTLAALTRDGLATRTAYPEVPPRVEYELTDLGRSLASAVDHLVGWVNRMGQGAPGRHRAESGPVRRPRARSEVGRPRSTKTVGPRLDDGGRDRNIAGRTIVGAGHARRDRGHPADLHTGSRPSDPR
jgi:DNA-binding HxlR family transcriptional regulator